MAGDWRQKGIEVKDMDFIAPSNRENAVCRNDWETSPPAATAEESISKALEAQRQAVCSASEAAPQWQRPAAVRERKVFS